MSLHRRQQVSELVGLLGQLFHGLLGHLSQWVESQKNPFPRWVAEVRRRIQLLWHREVWFVLAPRLPRLQRFNKQPISLPLRGEVALQRQRDRIIPCNRLLTCQPQTNFHRWAMEILEVPPKADNMPPHKLCLDKSGNPKLRGQHLHS